MSRHIRWLLLFTFSISIFACDLATSLPTPSPSTETIVSPASSPSAPPAGMPTITYQPAFEPGPCAFAVPSGYSPDCGYLVVPENRAHPNSPSIRLHLAIFRNRTGSPVPDPVVHLAGGPGSSSLDVADYLFGRGLDAILDRRDFILFDQRGTGHSQPRLDCPERNAITPTLLAGSLSAAVSQQVIVDAFRSCRDRLLAQGIDLSAYNSAASSADLNDLRLALGYDKLNLYAVSYGTRLALTLMRDDPNAVRSVVLDSTYPLQVNLYTALAPNAERAFNVFFDGCAADPSCSTAYPDLRTVFYQLVDELNSQPVAVSLFAGGAEQTVRLDGGLLIDVLFVGLYNPVVTASMPQMIYDIRQGNYTILSQRLALYFEPSSALGMQMAVQCAEEFPFNTPEEAYAAAQGVQPQIAAYYPVSVQPLFAVCREWAFRSPDPRENLAVSSDLPTLVLAGEQDPITPPEWGRMVVQDLSNSYFYEFPGNGHWVTRSSPCALQMALAFWANPTVDPGSACQ
ncbi:MAG TPA: alpha/beta fold hydrolase [Anaerolineales bacterium]|nr:alpha/beta fold hydrolase [Anaerolineales bacterium]